MKKWLPRKKKKRYKKLLLKASKLIGQLTGNLDKKAINQTAFKLHNVILSK